MAVAATEIKSFYDIPGFFWWLDRKVFAAVLGAQNDDEPGHLAELGVYLGRSSVIVGDFVRADERFVVVDLFGSTDAFTESEQDQANRLENETSYKTLTRQGFEANYLALHTKLPEVYQEPSSNVVEHLDPDTVRFLHIDASHLYPFVQEDVRNAKALLRRGGIVVFDDYRSEHTPGVSAAVWESVFRDGLIPVAVTPMKMYAVYEEESAEKYASALRALVANDGRLRSSEQEVLGRTLLLLNMAKPGAKTKPANTAAAELSPQTVAAIADEVARRVGDSLAAGAVSSSPLDVPDPWPTRSAVPTAQLSAPRRLVRAVARDYAPPRLTEWVIGRRRPPARR
jgi:hypothetical protein